MIYCQVEFGANPRADREASEEVCDGYLHSLLHNWQIYDDFYLTWFHGVLFGHVFLAGPDSFETRHHCRWAKENREKVVEHFQREPVWNIQDDDVNKPVADWRFARYFYLYAHLFLQGSPVFTDKGRPVAPYLLPLSGKQREYLFFWTRSYNSHDHLFIGSGTLEIPAYKEMADPNSQLMELARYHCEDIEKQTGKPTYCYVARYWGRKKGENKRVCPLCGKDWRTGVPVEKRARFWGFHFQCDPCRLVSHLADDDGDERHARIGEFKIKKNGTGRSI